jgi:hypothetical protein
MALAATREDVWVAMSNLYLDTDIELFIEPCASVLADSPFSREELARILFEEVHPALVLNLMSVAGEWGFFEKAWLCERILRQQTARAWRRWLARRLLRKYPRALWPRLDEIIIRLRSTRAAS